MNSWTVKLGARDFMIQEHLQQSLNNHFLITRWVTSYLTVLLLDYKLIRTLKLYLFWDFPSGHTIHDKQSQRAMRRPTLRPSDPYGKYALPIPMVRMDSDQIQMKLDPNVIFYHILIRIRIRMRILSDTNTKRIVRIWIPSWFET